MKFSLPAFALILAPGLALAGPNTGSKLAEGTQTPAEAIETWAKEGVSPTTAWKSLTTVRTRRVHKPGKHQLKLSDAYDRETDLLLDVPTETRADGKYALMVVLHGYGGNARQLFQFGRNVAPKGTVIAAVSAKKLKDAQEGIDVPAVGKELFAQFGRHWWSYRYDGFALLAIRKLIRELPIDTNRILLAGYSMGGFGTWNIGLRHHQHFAGLAPMAGGISRAEYLTRRDKRTRALLQNAKMQPAFFIHGNADTVVPHRFSKTIADDLKALKAPHTFIQVPKGSHVLMPFLRGNADTEVLKKFLADAIRNPNPRVVSHAAVGKDSGRAYWTRIDAVRGGTANLLAEIKPGNRIELTSKNVKTVTVYLDPDLVDTKKPVEILLDGKLVHRGVVKPSLQAVAESFARGACDPHLTYRHGLTIEHPTKGLSVKASAPKAKAKAKTKPRKAKTKKRWF